MFRIRKKIFPEKGFRRCEQEYQDHLERMKRWIDPELYRMFHEDCFHDGTLQNIRLNASENEAEFVLDSPNYLNRDKAFVDVDFLLKFSGITMFQFEEKTHAGKNPFRLAGSTFLHGEIGTLLPPRRAQSVVMCFLCNASNRIFYLSMIFRSLKIDPREPLAFRLLEQSGQLHL